ncbi:MAG: riboflavin synthase [Lactococcus sp.]
MFTGIVEEVGKIVGIQRGAKSSKVTVAGELIFSDMQLGDSIATNGVCLTVTNFSDKRFTADVMHETLDRSTLGLLRSGSSVNLERAMSAQGRFGGHIVSGHIDGVGTIQSIKKDDIAIWFSISASPSLMKYIVEKGSITIDGISLTVAKVTKTTFSVSVIPHTASHTILGMKKPSDTVNLENDIVGKYIEKMLMNESPTQPEASLTREKLTQYGF